MFGIITSAAIAVGLSCVIILIILFIEILQIGGVSIAAMIVLGFAICLITFCLLITVKNFIKDRRNEEN